MFLLKRWFNPILGARVMKDSDEMIAEFVHSNDIELIEGRSIPVREKWFTHYRRRSWTIRNGTKEVLFIGDLKVHIKEVTPDSFPRYTEIAMSCVWGTVINRSGFVPRLAFYARPSTGGDPVKLYEHDWDYLGFTCGGGECFCTRRWGDKNYFDEINFVDVLMPREFTFKDPPCDE